MNRSRITGDLVSQNNIFVDIANDRVGIGSTIPTQKLEVTGTVKATAFAGDGSNLDGINTDLVADTSPQLGGDLDVQASKVTTSTSNGNIKLEPNGTGVVEVRGAGGNDGTLQLNCSAQSHGIKLKSPPHSAAQSYTLTFPSSIVNNGALKTDSSGNLSFGLIANANVDASAAIAGTKISPDFGSQNIQTTGQLQISSTLPTILLNDTNSENDFEIRNQNGSFIIRDIDNPQTRYTIASSGMIHTFHGAASFSSNLDVGAGIDVTGEITATSHIDLPDNAKLKLGTSDDLEIFHDGTHSYIANSTGNLYVNAPTFFHLGVSNGGEKYLTATENGAVELYHDNIKKFDTQSYGAKVYGGLDSTGTITAATNIKANTDGGKLAVGASDDLQIYHDGNHSYIEDSGTGQLQILSDAFRVNNTANNENMIAADQDGAVFLRHNGATKFETTSSGVNVTDSDGSVNIKLTNNSGTAAFVYADGTNTGFLDSQSHFLVKGIKDGAVELYHDNSKKLQTQSGGVRVFGDLENHDNNFVAKDNCKFTAGNSEDLQLYHDGSNSYIDENGTGNLRIRNVNGNGIELISGTGELNLKCNFNGSVDLYHDGSKKFETTSAGATVTGALTTNNGGGNAVLGSHLDLGDNQKVRCGASDDLTIVHTGSESIIRNDTGQLLISCGGSANVNSVKIQPNHGENSISAHHNGGVELYFDNSKKLETTSDGATVTGSLTVTDDISLQDDLLMGDTDTIKLGNSVDLQIQHDGTDSHIKNLTGETRIQCANIFKVTNYQNTETYIKGSLNGSVELYHDNELRFETTADGATLQKGLTVRGIEGGVAQIRIEADEADNASDRFRLVATDSAGFFIQSYDGSQYENLFGGFLNGEVELYHNGSLKAQTRSDGFEIKEHLTMGDNDEIRLGNSADLKIYHSGTTSFIDNATSEFRIRSQFIALQPEGGGEQMAFGTQGGSFELYHDGIKRFETTNNGNRTNGELLYLGPNNSVNYVHSGGSMALTADTNIYFVADANDTSGVAPSGEFIWGGGSNTNTDTNQDFTNAEFGNNGQPRNQYMILDESSLRPASNGGINLGTSSLRFGNVYTQDLNLSNEGGANDVDGTWGNFTIQEGEDDLFLINRRNGKKYKFNLTEVQ